MTANNPIITRMDRLPATRMHYKVFFLIGLGMFLDSFDIYLAGGVLGALIKIGWSNVTLNATFISVSFMGLLIGALMTGFIGDSKGRKFAYQINLLIFGIASLAAALAPNMTVLIAIRGVIGIGLGAEIVTGYALLGEFAPPKTRGKWVSMLSLITNCAVPFSAFLGYEIIPTIGWRWMFVFVGVFALIVWFLRRNMPESPRWYVSKGMMNEAEKVVAEFEKDAEEKTGEKLPPIDTKLINSEESATEEKAKFSELFRGSMLKKTILGSLILVAINTLIYTFVTWVPTLFLKRGITVTKSLGYTTLMMIGAPLGSYLGSLIVDKFGRKWNLVGYFLLAGILGYAYSLQTSMTAILVIGFLLTIIIYILIAIGLAVYVPELFPTKLRLRGNGFANAVGRLATIFTPYGVAFLLTNYGVSQVFIALGIILAIVAVVTAVWGVETKQKSLD